MPQDGPRDDAAGDAPASSGRGSFTPLRQTKGVLSLGGGTRGGKPMDRGLPPRPQETATAGNEIAASLAPDGEGFIPLRKARSEVATDMQARLSFNSRAAREGCAEALEKRDPWRRLKANVSFTAAKDSEGSGVEARGSNAAGVVIVDPFSSGTLLAQRVIAEGYHCIRVLSVLDSPVAKLVQEGTVLQFDATLQFDDRNPNAEAAIADLLSQLKALPWEIAAVMPGAEPGVGLADVLSNRIGVASNGDKLSQCRRNKYLMGEQVRRCGVRAVRQMMARSREDCEAFLEDWTPDPFMAVVKPLESAGSDDVYLCHSAEEVRDAFETIDGKINGLGSVNEGALVQEYLDGMEYVVDTVSRAGAHRVCAIWEYDKRSINGANFVYFGMKLKSATGTREREIVDYAFKVLDAMGVVHGPGHMEVKYTRTGPCLVEVGTRCHGGEGTWQPIAQECLGYNQIDMTFNAYLNPSAWEAIPERPDEVRKAGREVFLVARESGMLRALPGLEEIKAFQSYRRQEIAAKPREFVYKTVDCFTRPGSVQLVHELESTVVREYDRIRSLEERGLFDFEIICPSPLPTPAVVVVDPFSSGSILAARVLQYKLRLVMVFSETDSPIAGMVQQGMHCNPDVAIQYDNANEDQDVAIQQTLQALVELPHPVIAILAGAETAVHLADILATRLGTRNNGEELTAARRNKYLMGEQIRSQGVRAARQRLVKRPQEINAFFDDWDPPSPWKAVVKPLDSAGSDDVHLVESREEARVCFKIIDGKVNGLGAVNEGALVMEYLDGTEYVVDSVSRDGVHRICAIWKYDKRAINGANFVYFGMELRPCAGKVEREIVAYARQVLDALRIENGPGHMEVKYTSTGPCLVEVGSRCHGGEGTWKSIVEECLGYDQIYATLDSFVKPDEFERVPMEPEKLIKGGKEVFLVSRQDGKILSVPGVDIIRGLPSFRTLEMNAQPGSVLRKTVDCFTRPGAVQLVNENLAQLEADYLRIRELEESGLFELSSEMGLRSSTDSTSDASAISDSCDEPSPKPTSLVLGQGGTDGDSSEQDNRAIEKLPAEGRGRAGVGSSTAPELPRSMTHPVLV